MYFSLGGTLSNSLGEFSDNAVELRTMADWLQRKDPGLSPRSVGLRQHLTGICAGLDTRFHGKKEDGYAIQTDPRRRHEAEHEEAASPASPIAKLAANPADFNSFVHTTIGLAGFSDWGR